ncbi:MAG: hypothetical protein AAF823_06560 [Planctomycetota bacterium]
MQEWWSPATSGIIGGLIGAIGGTFVGVVLGAGGAYLASRGKAKGLVTAGYLATSVVGIVLVIAALAAWLMGQPYHVWYPLGLPGVLFTLLPLFILPGIRMHYAAKEQQRLEGELAR